MRVWVGVALAAALAASVSSAKAQSTVEVGMIDCRGKSTSYILTSVTQLECVYSPSSGGRPSAYLGTMRLFGVDVGINQSTAMRWAVFAPTHRIGPGDLAGRYIGASANATVGVGVGANALWGGSNNTIALQPLGVQGQIGIGAAGGVSSFELVPVRMGHRAPHRRHRHH